MKNLTTITFMVLFSNIMWGQTLVFKGNVIGNGISDKGKLYFANQGESFSKKNTIKYSKKKGYEFSIPYDKVFKDSIGNIFISANMNTKLNDKNGCFCTLDFEAIRSRGQYWIKTDYTVFETDLLVTENCEETLVLLDIEDCEETLDLDTDAPEYGFGRFVKWYKMETPEINSIVTFTPDNRYIGDYYSPGKKNKMTSEIGNWKYNPKNKILTIVVLKERNMSIGLVKVVDRTYHLKLMESGEDYWFESENIKIKRNNR